METCCPDRFGSHSHNPGHNCTSIPRSHTSLFSDYPFHSIVNCGNREGHRWNIFQHKSKFAAIGLGILVIILAIIALVFPVGATTVLIFIMAFALMFDGFARIIQGFGDKQETGWVRGFYIGAGILAVIISVMVLASPLFGAALAGFLIGIALLIIGIQMISAGIAGREARLRPSIT